MLLFPGLNLNLSPIPRVLKLDISVGVVSAEELVIATLRTSKV